MTTLSCVGDIFLDRPDPPSIFEPTSSARAADVMFGHCEAAVARGRTEWLGKPQADNCLKMEPEMLDGFRAAGVHAVSLANNHALDFGAAPLLETYDAFREAGIRTCGAGRNLDEAHAPAIVRAGDLTVAFLSYTSVFMPGWEATESRSGVSVVRVGTAYRPHARILEQPGSPATTLTLPDQEDVARLTQDIRAARRAADVVVVSWHWGVSGGYRRLVPYQTELAHLAIDEGADLLIGHHPHCLQGVEVYKGRAIFYSLGNFAFDYEHASFEPETLIVRCEIEKGAAMRVSAIPCLIGADRIPRVATGEAQATVVDRLRAACEGLDTRWETRDGRLQIV